MRPIIESATRTPVASRSSACVAITRLLRFVLARVMYQTRSPTAVRRIPLAAVVGYKEYPPTILPYFMAPGRTGEVVHQYQSQRNFARSLVYVIQLMFCESRLILDCRFLCSASGFVFGFIGIPPPLLASPPIIPRTRRSNVCLRFQAVRKTWR